MLSGSIFSIGVGFAALSGIPLDFCFGFLLVNIERVSKVTFLIAVKEKVEAQTSK